LVVCLSVSEQFRLVIFKDVSPKLYGNFRLLSQDWNKAHFLESICETEHLLLEWISTCVREPTLFKHTSQVDAMSNRIANVCRRTTSNVLLAGQRQVQNHTRIISRETVILPFLYPKFFLQSQRRSFNHTSISKQQQQEDVFIDVSGSEQKAVSTPATGSSVEEDPWAYLYGQGEPEEEPTLYVPPVPVRKRSSGIFNIEKGSNFAGDKKKARPAASVPPRIAKPYKMGETISEREKEIFDSIFDVILKTKGAAGEYKPQQSRGTFSPPPMIAALFESALGPQKFGESLSFGPERTTHNSAHLAAAMAKISTAPQYPHSLRNAAARAAGMSGLPLTEAEKKLESERRVEMEKLLGQMEQCATDKELWDFLDDHVFSLVYSARALNQPQTEATSKTTSSSKKTKASKVEPEEPTFNIPSTNYPHLLHSAMFLLRTAFNDYPSVIAVYNQVKALGAESYVVGCSTEVYNEVLRARWEGFKNLEAVNGLLAEMRINGVPGDHETVQIMMGIKEEISHYREDSKLVGANLLWGKPETNDELKKLEEGLDEVLASRQAV